MAACAGVSPPSTWPATISTSSPFPVARWAATRNCRISTSSPRARSIGSKAVTLPTRRTSRRRDNGSPSGLASVTEKRSRSWNPSASTVGGDTLTSAGRSASMSGIPGSVIAEFLFRHHALGSRLEVEGGGEQRAGIVVLGRREDVGGRAFLHHLAVAHHPEPARHGGHHLEIVREEHLGEIGAPPGP